VSPESVIVLSPPSKLMYMLSNAIVWHAAHVHAIAAPVISV
jgi:hypothetical protein